MTPARAQAVITAQSQWPFWGNFSKFMTAGELATVDRLWMAAPGNWSRASVVYALARGELTDGGTQ